MLAILNGTLYTITHGIIDCTSTAAYRNFRVGPAQMTRRLVSAGDRVYVTLGYDAPVTALDAASGETVLTYDDSRNTEEIILTEDPGGFKHLAEQLGAGGDPSVRGAVPRLPDPHDAGTRGAPRREGHQQIPVPQ